ELHTLGGVVDRDVATEVVRSTGALPEQGAATELDAAIALEGGVTIDLGGADVAAELGVADIELAGHGRVDDVGIDHVGRPDRLQARVCEVDLALLGDDAL